MKLKLQKFCPVDREHPIIEIIEDSGDVLLDVSRNDGGGEVVVCFHPAVVSRVIPYEQVVAMLEQARARAEADD